MVCHVCLSRNRNTFSLGVYHGIFNRVLSLHESENQDVKLCWECLSLLKKIKRFLTKYKIARRILKTGCLESQPRTCLSTLTVVTPAKINILNNDDNISEFNKTEDISIVYKQSLNINANEANNLQNERKHDCNEDSYNDDHISAGTDQSSDIEYLEYLRKTKSDLDNYIEKNDTKRDPNDTDTKKDICIMKTENIEGNVDFETKTHNIDNNTDTDIKVNLNNICKIKKLIGPRRTKGLNKQDYEGHFRIVFLNRKDIKKYRTMLKIEPSELEYWRESERLTEYFTSQPFKCHDCIYGFPSLKKKYEHDLKYHNLSNVQFTCQICATVVRTRDELDAHVSRHYYLHACRICWYRCVTRRALRWHVARHQSAVLCAHCVACFANVGQFNKHFKTHHTSVFECDHCGRRCRTKYTLEKHMRHHTEPNVCPICNKSYASRNSLRNHRELKHGARAAAELAYCVMCDKQFASVPLYRRHVRVSGAHAAERNADRKKQVSCPICGNVYTRQTYMMNHYRHVHMKQSKYHCNDCDRNFLNRTRYVEHRRYQHEGEIKVKDKLCNVCGRGFAENRTLVNHLRTHSGERPYECAHCDARFAQKHSMLSHVRRVHLKTKRRGF